MLEITIKASGDYTALLQHIKPGGRVLVDGPHGKFTLQPAASQPLLMIAGGVGITPLYSMLQAVSSDQPITLIYGCKSERDKLFRSQLDELAKTNNLEIKYVYSNPKVGPGQYIDSSILKQVKELNNRQIFLCGPVPMMDSVTTELLQLGVNQQNIHSERFDY